MSVLMPSTGTSHFEASASCPTTLTGSLTLLTSPSQSSSGPLDYQCTPPAAVRRIKDTMDDPTSTTTTKSAVSITGGTSTADDLSFSSTNSIADNNELTMMMMPSITPPLPSHQQTTTAAARPQRRVIFPTLYSPTPTKTPINNDAFSSSSCLQKRLQWRDSVDQQQRQPAVDKAAGLPGHLQYYFPPLQLSSPLVLPKSPGLTPRAIQTLLGGTASMNDDMSPEMDLLQQLPAGCVSSSLTTPPPSRRSSKACSYKNNHRNRASCTIQSNPAISSSTITTTTSTTDVPCYRRNQRMILPVAAQSARLVAMTASSSSCCIASPLDFIMAPSLAVGDTDTAPALQPLTPPPPTSSAATTIATSTSPEGPRRLRSILKSSRSYERKNSSSGNSSNTEQEQQQQQEALLVSKIPSVESDLPSLASSTMSCQSSSLDGCRTSSSTSGVSLFCLPHLNRSTSSTSTMSPPPTPPLPSFGILHRSQSAPPVQRSSGCGSAVAFDPRVWVREFQRSHNERLGVTWYTASDLERFKLEAFQRIIHYDETTTRLSDTSTRKHKALFSHCALQAGSDETTMSLSSSPTAASPCSTGSSTTNKCISTRRREALRAIVTMEELRKVLIILHLKPSSSYLVGFSESLKNFLPHVQVVHVRSHGEAMKRVQEARFDVILTEQPQQDGGGSSAPASTSSSVVLSLQHVRSQFDNDDKSLFVSVMDKTLQQQQNVKKATCPGGADLCWTTPLELSQGLVDTMLQQLLLKRGRITMARELAL